MSRKKYKGEPAPADASTANRMVSVDALRGFDMFWITGGEGAVGAVAALFGGASPGRAEFNLVSRVDTMRGSFVGRFGDWLEDDLVALEEERADVADHNTAQWVLGKATNDHLRAPQVIAVRVTRRDGANVLCRSGCCGRVRRRQH